MPSQIDACHNVEDFRKLERRRLPGPIFHYIDRNEAPPHLGCGGVWVSLRSQLKREIQVLVGSACVSTS
jgi:hypothetical protein